MRRTLASLIPVVCPPLQENTTPSKILDDGLAALSAFPSFLQIGFRTGAAAYEQGARLWLPARGLGASSLSQEKAKRYFDLWWKSNLRIRREFARGVKSVLCFGYYEQPEVLAGIGYTPQQWIDKVRSEREAKFRAAIEQRRQDLVTPDPLPPFRQEASTK